MALQSLTHNPGRENIRNFLAATNAVAEQLRQNGEPFEFLSAKNAAETFKRVQRMLMIAANPDHEKHVDVTNSLKNELGGSREALNNAIAVGEQHTKHIKALAALAVKNGYTQEQALVSAMNSVAGNPVYDHFANLNLLAGQLFEEMTFVETFLESGDAFNVPLEAGGQNYDKSRFRAPTERLTGSAKTIQGDINPSERFDDNNKLQIDLINEFKTAQTIGQSFDISQEQRDQIIGYDKAVAPALAGFLLQNRMFSGAQKQIMKSAEEAFVFGQDAAANYIPGVGGSYGILSSAIQLQLSDWNTANPLVAKYSDWIAAPTKLIQKIQNYYYKPTSVSGSFELSVDPSLMYKDIVRLLGLAAQQNVDFGAKEWVIYVPTSWYALAMQYPGTMAATGSGVFNKQLDEMVRTATGGKIINRIVIKPSSLLNYGAANGRGGTNSYNYMIAVAQGCTQEKKPIIMPGQTSVPYIVSEQVTAMNMRFRSKYLFGGPMVMQYGGAFIMEFSLPA